VKTIADYVERAIQFERMAVAETDPKLKESLRAQAQAYRKLVDKRARALGTAAPSAPPRQKS
jgi:hypothetical protein